MHNVVVAGRVQRFVIHVFRFVGFAIFTVEEDLAGGRQHNLTNDDITHSAFNQLQLQLHTITLTSHPRREESSRISTQKEILNVFHFVITMHTESWSSFHGRYQRCACPEMHSPSSRKSLGGRMVGSIASLVAGGRRRGNPLRHDNSDGSSRTIYSLHDIDGDMGLNISSRSIGPSRSFPFE